MKSYEFLRKIKNFLSRKRLLHTLGVIKVSLFLAKKYKVNQKKVFISAILHDIAKEIKISKQKNIINKFDDELKKIMPIWHSFVSAKVAKKIFKIKNNQILDAIKYHSTGNTKMGNIEKIIFIADYIEPNRRYLSSIKIRKMLNKKIELDKLVLLVLEKKLIYLIKEKKYIYSDSIKLWNNLAKIKSQFYK